MSLFGSRGDVSLPKVSLASSSAFPVIARPELRDRADRGDSSDCRDGGYSRAVASLLLAGPFWPRGHGTHGPGRF